MGFRDLVAFLTALPVGPGSIEGAARSYPLTPLAGVVVGVVALAGAWAGWPGGPLLAASLYLAAHVAATGALHLDGYADFSDVLHSGARGGDALKVLKDPRRGSGALVSVSVLITVQVASVASLLESLGPTRAWPELLVSHALAYEAMYLASANLPPPPYRGLARIFRDHGLCPRCRAANLAAFAASLAPAAAAHPVVLASEALGWLAGLVATLHAARSRLGFANGDVLGFANELSRTAALLGAAVAAGVAAGGPRL